MQKLLRFVDNYCIEEQLYFRISTLYSGTEYEVQWRSKESIKWQFRPVGDDNWVQVASDNLVKTLNGAVLDLGDLEVKIRGSMLQQVAYCHSFTRKATDLFGEEVIKESIDAHRKFLDELGSVIKDLLLPGNASESKTTKPQPSLKTPSTEPRRLRLLTEPHQDR